jgi:uncharacterized protein GlcG (DUF336 family)
MLKKAICMGIGLSLSLSAWAADREGCGISADIINRIQSQLPQVVMQNNGGIFYPGREWSAIVDRNGRLCSVVKAGDAQPYARAVAIAKAGTANGFSNDAIALSTANLYSSAQPGGVIFGYHVTNPFNPEFLAPGSGIGAVAGGVVTSGGGVPLYLGGKVIGGLGLAGDSACADHVMAYRIRRAAGLDKIPAGVGYHGTDNIDYLDLGQAPAGFKHPHCFPQDILPANI